VEYGEPQRRKHTVQRLDVVLQLMAAKDRLQMYRAQLVSLLGVWAVEAELDDQTWRRVVDGLVSAAPDVWSAAALLQSRWHELDAHILEIWQLEAWPSAEPLKPPYTGAQAQRWVTALLVRAIAPHSAPQLDLGREAELLATHILEELDAIESDPDQWSRVIDDDFEARVAAARYAVTDAVARAKHRAAQELAHAELDLARVDAFASELQGEYARHDVIRRELFRAHAVEITDQPSAFNAPVARRVLPKQRFTTLSDSESPWPAWYLGREACEAQFAAACRCLARHAPRRPGRGVDAAIAASIEMRGRGVDPDAILIPREASLLKHVESHKRWKYGHVDDTPLSIPPAVTSARGTLAGVPVYSVDAADGDVIIVCRLGSSLRRVERHHRQHDSPLHVDVATINAERAADLVRAGTKVEDVDSVAALQEQALRDAHVEVLVFLDVRVAPSEDDIAAVRVGLPKQTSPAPG
jgi:hypothetical protein